MLPIGLNMCSPADQELINLAKIRYSLVILNILSRLQSWCHHGIQMVNWPTLQRDTDEEVREFLQNNLHLQGKVLVPRCSVSYQELRGVIKAHSLQYIFPSYVLCCGTGGQPVHALADGPVQGDGREGRGRRRTGESRQESAGGFRSPLPPGSGERAH